VVVVGAVVVAFIFSSLFVLVMLAFLPIVPMALLHCLWAFNVKIDFCWVEVFG